MDIARQMEERSVQINIDSQVLDGNLTISPTSTAVVLFAHGSGSSRHSPRNRFVAQYLNQAGLATLLMDLLTAEEESIDMYNARLRFDIAMLAERVVSATDWLSALDTSEELNIGYFGASTGAAAALVAAVERPELVKAIVSRGGRPDLAGPVLNRVQAPTLLIVGGNDEPVISMNKDALDQMNAVKEMKIVPGATHLFEEPGTLEEVARMATEWFLDHL